MHSTKLKTILFALLALLLTAGCGDDEKRRGGDSSTATNNDNSTNNDQSTNNDSGDLPASIVDGAEDARAASESYFATYCDCYTDSLYDGDRSKCEATLSTGQDTGAVQASDCEKDVFRQYEDDYVAYYACMEQEMGEADTCLSSCPEPSELGTCTEGLADCTMSQEVVAALQACQDGA